MKYLYLDVANTLLHKPSVFKNIQTVLFDYSIQVELEEIKFKHKLCSELIKFPDKTNIEFYNHFNKEFLLTFGISADDKMLEDIFKACTYQPWVPFEDVKFLKQVSTPIGIISNWDKSLESKLNELIDLNLDTIIGSEEFGTSKPNLKIFEAAILKANVEPQDIIYVGDSIKLDVEPALNLGIKSYLIDRDNTYPNANVPRICSFEEIVEFNTEDV